jgi:hypothetical protein
VHNPFVDERLRKERIDAAQHLVDALADTLSKSVRGGCAQYKP